MSCILGNNWLYYKTWTSLDSHPCLKMEAPKVSKLGHRHSDHYMPESGIWLGGGEADFPIPTLSEFDRPACRTFKCSILLGYNSYPNKGAGGVHQLQATCNCDNLILILFSLLANNTTFNRKQEIRRCSRHLQTRPSSDPLHRSCGGFLPTWCDIPLHCKCVSL